VRLLGEQTSKGTWASAQMKAQEVGQALMLWGVQFAVSTLVIVAVDVVRDCDNAATAKLANVMRV